MKTAGHRNGVGTTTNRNENSKSHHFILPKPSAETESVKFNGSKVDPFALAFRYGTTGFGFSESFYSPAPTDYMAVVSHPKCFLHGKLANGGYVNSAPATSVVSLNGHNHHHNNHHRGVIGSFDSNHSSTATTCSSSSNSVASSNNSLLIPKALYGTYSAPLVNCQPDRPIGYGAFGVVWAVTDPRTAKRVALKKMPNVFQNLASCKRVFREIKMLSSFKHDNVITCLDILQPSNSQSFQEIYVLTELMQSDLHKIIVSPQPLTSDHVKIFMYQILRGVKYLHSANIIHRDIKPGNLLVNSNCLLKICDFGLARFWDKRESGNLTHEVVTQYYRAPELLMGTRKYTSAVDVWSIGCIFAEILGRRILFQAQGPIDQLNLIIDLLGSPSVENMKYACEGARNHVLKSAYKASKMFKLDVLSSHATKDAVSLLKLMLVFDPDQRITVDEALNHLYLDEGRIRFHSCMCTCCVTKQTAGGGTTRVFGSDLDPNHLLPFDVKWERELSKLTMYDLRDRLYKFITERPPSHGIPLCINVHSANYHTFSSSSVAQPSEMPPSPHAW